MKLKCKICEHEWESRKVNPKKCANPECRSMLWNRDKKEIPHENIMDSIVFSKLIIGLMRLKYYDGRKTQEAIHELTGIAQPLISSKLNVLKNQGYVDHAYVLNFEKIIDDFYENISLMFEKKKKELIDSENKITGKTKSTKDKSEENYGEIKSKDRVKEYYVKLNKDMSKVSFNNLGNPCANIIASKELRLFIGRDLASFMVNDYYQNVSKYDIITLRQIFELYTDGLLESMTSILVNVGVDNLKMNPLQEKILDFILGLREIKKDNPYSISPSLVELFSN